MKPAQFHVPGSLWVERSLRKEGPSPVYVAWRPHTSRLFYEVGPLLKFCLWPKSTPTGQAFRDWLSSFEEEEAPRPELDESKIRPDNWGPESHPEEPNENTRTVI